MHNKLFVGFSKEMPPPRAGLFIDDEVPKIPLARVFGPKTNSFNPLAGITYKKAREICVEVLSDTRGRLVI